MAPAFSSVRQAAAFAILLLGLLILPAVMGPSLLPPREEVYSSSGWANGGWPYIHQQIFQEKGDIDVAFIGPSHVWYGIDDRYVQEKLSQQLGRPAVVRSFCWGTAGYDTIYFVAKDLLSHRKIHLLVFYDDRPQSTEPHGRMTRLFRLSEDAVDIQGLSFPYKTNYYLAAVLGMPRNLLDWLRNDRPADLAANNTFEFVGARTENIVNRLGSLGVRAGFASGDYTDHGPFQPFTPSGPTPETRVVVYPKTNSQEVTFDEEAVPPLQKHFIKKFLNLAESHGTRVALINIPRYSDRRNAVVIEGEPWKNLLPNLTIVGIPPADMFANLTDADVQKLYADAVHLNVNGQAYFTSTITPGLLQVYAEKIIH